MPQIPPSLAALGYVPLEELSNKRCLMIGVEGETNTGKNEFAFSAPGPIGVLQLDRNIDGVAHNPKPPETRSKDGIYLKLITTLGNIGTKGQAPPELKKAYLDDWNHFYAEHKKILAIPELATVVYDGASDDWEIQRLAEFGTLSQIPSILYDSANASRKKMIRDMYDSGKNIIATHKVTDVYEDVKDAQGNPVMNERGKTKQAKTGEYRRQGFHDTKYLFQIQLRMLKKDAYFNETLKRQMPLKFGCKILECKPRQELKGEELWGDECNFAGLVSLIWPDVPLEEWGL